MRRPRPPRRIVLAAAAAGALAAATAGCGREGDLGDADATPTARTTTILTEPYSGTTPLTATTPRRPKPDTRMTATTPRPPPATRTTATTPQRPPGTATTPTTTTPPDPSAALPEDERLRRAAAEHARNTFRLPVTSADVTLVRSRRKPRWAIASGTYGRTPWVVWLRDGKVALGTTNAERFNPIGVPCDVRPAFSEPSC